MKYGEKPIEIGLFKVDVKEMFFYQYMPILMKQQNYIECEDRLRIPFRHIINKCIEDFKNTFGIREFNKSVIYITAKNQYQKVGCAFNRNGYHSDGFMTKDINYIWCDSSPTIFNSSDFKITQDDKLSLQEMESQALKENEFFYPENTLLRLNQFNIHKVNENNKEGMRCFLKISFSRDKYDLKGNTKNHLLRYNWHMRDRELERNIPQLIK